MTEANNQNLKVIDSGEGKPIEILDMATIKKMQEAFINENENEKIVPEKSTKGIHIFDGRSFRAYSW